MPYVPPHLRNKAAASNSTAQSTNSASAAAMLSSSASFSSAQTTTTAAANTAVLLSRPVRKARGGEGGASAAASSNNHHHHNNHNNSAAAAPFSSSSSSFFLRSRSVDSATTSALQLEPWAPSARVLALNAEQVADIRARLNVTVMDTASTSTSGVENGGEKDDAGETNGDGCAFHIPPIEAFADMNLARPLQQAIADRDFTAPTPIQAAAVPVALSGRDLLACAQTGSGKTASFAIPLVQHCAHWRQAYGQDRFPIAAVLAPTRELAQQIENEISLLSRACSVRTAILVGGMPMWEQSAALSAGVEAVVATPGRLLDHVEQRNTRLGQVSFVVLDEADRMLDLGFERDIRKILGMLKPPALRQALLFSATMPEEIEKLANEILRRPVQIRVGKVSNPAATVTQALMKTTEADKLDLLLQLIVQEQAAAAASGAGFPLTIVFVERKAKCDEITEAINELETGVVAAALHGGRTQTEREHALRGFKEQTTPLLIATDVAARGLDVQGVAHVINLDLPRAFEDYVHRIGRTGRAGASGKATSLYTDRDSFIVTQIRAALAAAEKGDSNAFSVASGKAARAREREQRAADAADRANRNSSGEISSSGVHGGAADGKYHHMMRSFSQASLHSEDGAEGGGMDKGVADDAWDD